jgi:hypothetical protein
LNDVHKAHKCVYIRQYHNIRPYIVVNKVPGFKPKELPYWSIYETEGKDATIQVGGTMAGQVSKGLSGGQRKLFLFELIYQRTRNETGLLILLDEPFAGVTDDFVPWIVDRLKQMGERHNVVVVTNDYVSTLSDLADTTIQLSAIDRTKLLVDQSHTDRAISILALSNGSEFAYKGNDSDWEFFLDIEIIHSRVLTIAALWILVSYTLFLFTFWNSSQESAALVLVANELLGYYTVLPFLLSLPDWRHYMGEESEALLHSSKGKSRLWKSFLALALLFSLALFQYGIINVVIEGLSSPAILLGIFFDCFSNQVGFIIFGLYSSLPNETAYALAGLPCIASLFFSTTYSPGAGLPVLKDLRYLFPRFYLWCMVPDVQDDMEGCPADDSVHVLLMALSGTLYVWLFLGAMLVRMLINKARKAERKKERAAMEESHQFQTTRTRMFESKVLDATFDSTDGTDSSDGSDSSGYGTNSLASSFEC